jgi:hypothetical protein
MARPAGIASGIPLGETRLSKWHPYPAMVPDELAVKIVNKYVMTNDKVLDPFCGSGRLLMASAAVGANCVGYDVNPLALLLTRAKSARICPTRIKAIRDLALVESLCAASASPITLRTPVKVQWFSHEAAVELAQIVRWINGANFSLEERLVLAVALSGATRDAAWIRKSGWKLHRMSEADRDEKKVSAWSKFIRRLDHYVSNHQKIPMAGTVSIIRDDIRYVDTNLHEKFDHILTSPPYGDSKTTVQYGAASGICLDVISRILGLEDFAINGNSIDRACLGGYSSCEFPLEISLKPYWAGSPDGPHIGRVRQFLEDFDRSCAAISSLIKSGGTVTLIVARRTVGGFRLKLDDFSVDRLSMRGLNLLCISKRQLQNKRLPNYINRFAASSSIDMKSKGHTKTMDEEIVITMKMK